jgi:hypothetical protein
MVTHKEARDIYIAYSNLVDVALPKHLTVIHKRNIIKGYDYIAQQETQSKELESAKNGIDQLQNIYTICFKDLQSAHKYIKKQSKQLAKVEELLEVYRGIDGGGSPDGLNKLYVLRDKLEKEMEELR